MNKQPIEAAKDADLRLSMNAMQRAAQRARELAAQSGTAIVISHQGVVRLIRPTQTPDHPTGAQEPTAPYGDKS